MSAWAKRYLALQPLVDIIAALSTAYSARNLANGGRVSDDKVRISIRTSLYRARLLLVGRAGAGPGGPHLRLGGRQRQQQLRQCRHALPAPRGRLCRDGR